MVEASRGAAAPSSKGGLPNALFVVAAVEAPPPELVGRADLVAVRFPWGSLLRGVLGLDPCVAAGLASLARPSGAIEGLLSVTDRDGVVDPRRAFDLTRLRAFWHELSFKAIDLRPASHDEIVDSGSTWARRLTAGGASARPVMRLSLSLAPDDNPGWSLMRRMAR